MTSGDGQTTNDPQTSEALAVHAENARWLIDRASVRIDSFHQRAATLLGFTGVILAILPSVLDPIARTPGPCLRLSAWIVALVSAVALASGSAASLMVLLIRNQLDVGMDKIVQRWVDTTTGSFKMIPGQVLSDYANAYFGRAATERASVLLALKAQGDSKASWLRISMWLSAAGIVLLGALLAILVGGRI